MFDQSVSWDQLPSTLTGTGSQDNGRINKLVYSDTYDKNYEQQTAVHCAKC